MGLSGPKNKRKLGNDPNNTKWSRNTDSFGHRMLRSQGWEPGQFLGPQNSAHAAFHTAASASHIRVALKDDNLGLGAKINRGDECTGLNAFKDMLARLNGKSEAAIEQDKKAKEDHMRSVYIERKFGTVRFVRGGFLVGDKMESTELAKREDASKNSQDSATVSSAEEAVEAKAKKEKKSKKRKAEDAEDETRSREERRSEKKKRRKEISEKSEDGSRTPETENDDDSTAAKTSKKNRKEKKREKRKSKGEAACLEKDSADDKTDERKDKKAKKEKKKRDKERRRKDSGEASADEEPSRESTAVPTTGTSTPVESGTSTPVSQVSARYLSRRRFIAQKRMALNDPQALNQIFMIKSS